MARTPVVKIINGHEWEVTPWPGGYGLKMQARLVPMLKGITGALGEAATAGGAIMDVNIATLVEGIAGQIDDDKTPRLIKDMLFGAAVDNKDITMDKHFDNHFTANFAELYKGLAFVLEVNFSDFFELVGGNTGSQPAPAGQKAKAIREG